MTGKFDLNVLGRLSRRAFFAAAPAVGLGAKAAADQAVAALSGIEVGARSSQYLDIPGVPGNPNEAPHQALYQYDRLDPRQIMELIGNDSFKREYESLLYESNKYVHSIDHDIAVHRSFSLAAKIAFQRQRNVARALKYIEESRESSWDKAAKMVERHLGINFKEWWRERNGRHRDAAQAQASPR